MELVLFLFQWIDHIKIGNCLSAEFEGKVSFNCSVETGILKGFQSKILGQESLHHMALEEWPVLETVGEGWCQEAADNGLQTCVQSFTASVDLDYDSRGQGEQGITLKPWWWSQDLASFPSSSVDAQLILRAACEDQTPFWSEEGSRIWRRDITNSLLQ